MQNLAKKPFLASGSDFTMDISIGNKATLEVQGYALRLTKEGKKAFPNLPLGNLSDAEITTVRNVCDATSKAFSGKGGMVYQLTAYKNAKDNHEFINTFNPNCEAGEVIEVEAYQRKNADGTLATYTAADGTVYPSVSIKIAPVTTESSNSDLVKEEQKEGAKPPVNAKLSKENQ